MNEFINALKVAFTIIIAVGVTLSVIMFIYGPKMVKNSQLTKQTVECQRLLAEHGLNDQYKNCVKETQNYLKKLEELNKKEK